ncbi:MAG: DUF2269 domain-containing protein [Alphaproteobacteria bacterium]|nr:DUF2269 domain-containing protein [Alphaproteobacteria bacterium]
MEPFFLVKIVHILSATLLFGTGLGTAFHMWFAYRRGDAKVLAVVTSNVVLADWLFTASSGAVQVLTGLALIYLGGHDPLALWLQFVYGLYVLALACWLPVVAIQYKVRDLARKATNEGSPLPVQAHRLMRIWFALGWPAFLALVGIFALMVIRPT